MKPLRLTVAQKICRNLPPIFAQRLRSMIYPIELAYRDDYEFIVRAQTGSILKNKTSDFHAYPFSVYGYYEWRNVAIALVLCSAGETIIEIGANVGTETISFADIVGSSGKVYAFEPPPLNLTSLEATVRLNQFQNVTVLPFAIGEDCKKMHFQVPPTRNASGSGHILGKVEQSAPNMIVVDCVTLDSLADRIGPVKMVFIDAEGAEVMILRGARSYLKRDKPSIVLEACPNLLVRAGFTLQDLYSELKSSDYEAFRISRLGVSRIDSEASDLGTSRTYNWLCVHLSRLEVVASAEKHLKMCGLLPCIKRFNPLSSLPR